MRKLLGVLLMTAVFVSCSKKKNNDPEPENPPPANTCPTCEFPDTAWAAGTNPNVAELVFKFKFDSTQARLNNLGQATVVAAGNAGQCPKFNGMSAHYIELAPKDSTLVGGGKVLYRADETNCAGSNAIVFCKSVVCKEGDVFFSVPISSITPGSYKWLRVSLAYQNYDIKVKTGGQILDGTVASFVGFNTYVTKFKMKNAVMTPSVSPGPGNHLQGYWGFYTKVGNTEYFSDGQAAGTTVVNPNNSLSPIPPGSCLVTGKFFSVGSNTETPLVITGSETNDIIITVSLSTNKSFEWKETNFDGIWEPGATPAENVVDMGLRGLVAKIP